MSPTAEAVGVGGDCVLGHHMVISGMGISGRWNSYLRFLGEELSARAPSLSLRARAITEGHPSLAIAMLSDAARFEGRYIRQSLYYRRRGYHNRMLYAALHNKISQKLWLDRIAPGLAPPMTHYLAGGSLVSLSESGPDRPVSALPEIIDQHHELFLKPSDAGAGQGAFAVSRSGDQYSINDQIVSRGDVVSWAKKLGSGYTLSRRIIQSVWASKLFPHSVNTLRVMTATSVLDHRAVILGAAMKAGRPRSLPTDNFKSGRGGIACGVELRTGRMGPGVTWDDASGRRIEHAEHPETGTVLDGALVPHWTKVSAGVNALAARLPRPGLVGWDIAICENGFVVVEANTLPGIDLLQSTTSILDTDEKRAILREFRMIS